MKIRIIQFIFFTMMLSSCGGNQAAQSDPPLPNKPMASGSENRSEDEIILQLSAHLVANPENQNERDQNAIVDYAIEQLLPLERTPSGLFYYIQEPGEGELLKWADYIKVDYQGYFLDGKVFDDTRKRGKPLQFYIGNMIKGWNEGLQLVAPGGRILLAVPSALAYGKDGLPDGKGGLLVPENTPLVFEVEVLEKLEAPK
ncbi:MAG: FKBP-type peptidyl-prolyl cis-trans isomerase [Saprospiraceae bacterium]|nr:FKBP-type peptidyl-prolyl cis-trans isomerase [Lewinella sp.]